MKQPAGQPGGRLQRGELYHPAAAWPRQHRHRGSQYRDATIESEPSVLGTAAIIGVAGAGTAVIVWQGYRIGMELYEKYFQPTPEEDAVVEPTLESQMTDPIS